MWTSFFLGGHCEIDKSMKLKVNLAGTIIGLTFLGQARKAIRLCNQYFQGFLCSGQRCDAEVEVSILEKAHDELPYQGNTKPPIFEQLLPIQKVAAWLRAFPEYTEDFPISEDSVSAYCHGGLLLFDPNTKAGRIYLLRQGSRRFQPIYRILWIYFAQVLGECGACFVHAAALAKDGEGYLFMGDSGAGKSTLAGMCKDCNVLSDDGPILSKQNGECLVYPSPYSQINRINGGTNRAVHMAALLKGMYFLIKGEGVLLEEVSKGVALLHIINRFIHFFPYLSVYAKTTLFELFSNVCYEINSYNFCFRLDRDIGDIIFRR